MSKPLTPEAMILSLQQQIKALSGKPFRVPTLATSPDDVSAGAIWMRSDQHKLYLNDGTTTFEVYTTSDPQSGISGGSLGDRTVPNTKLMLNTLTANEMANGAVTTPVLANGAVDGSKLAGSITYVGHIGITADLPSAVPLSVAVPNSQTADVFQVFDAAGQKPLYVTPDGRTHHGPTPTNNGFVTIDNNKTVTDPSLSITQGLSQTGRGVELRNASGSLVAWVDFAGASSFASVATSTFAASTSSSLAAATASSLSVGGTSTLTGFVTMPGGASLGSLTLGVKQFTSYTATLPTTVNNTIILGSLTVAGGGAVIEVSCASDSTTAGPSKRYVIPCYYNGTAGAWQSLSPSWTSGAVGTNDYALEVNISNAVVQLRLRNTLGSATYNVNTSIATTASTTGFAWSPLGTLQGSQAVPGATYTPSQVAGSVIPARSLTGTQVGFDTITGATAAGVGNIAAGTINGYNIANLAITAGKLTAGAALAAIGNDGGIPDSLVNSLGASKIIAGTINVDDIFFGPSGHIYLGPTNHAGTTGQRIELNSGGVFSYDSTNTQLASFTPGGFSLKSSTSGARVVLDTTGLVLYAADGVTKNFWLDDATGNATFSGALQAATGTFGGAVAGGSLAIPSTGASSRVTIDATLGMQVWWGGVQTVSIPLTGNPILTGLTIQGNSTFSGAITSSATISGGALNIPDAVSAGRLMLDATNGLRVYSGGVLTVQLPPTGSPTMSGLTISGNSTFTGSITSTATISGGTLSGATVVGGTIETAASGTRMVIGGGTPGTTYAQFFAGLTGETAGSLTGGALNVGMVQWPYIYLTTGKPNATVVGTSQVQLIGVASDGSRYPSFVALATPDSAVTTNLTAQLTSASGPPANAFVGGSLQDNASNDYQFYLNHQYFFVSGVPSWLSGGVIFGNGDVAEKFTNFAWGTYSATTTTGAQPNFFTFNHNLSWTPTIVFFQHSTPTGGANQGYPIGATTITSTQITGRYFASAGSLAGVAVTGIWLAIA